MELFYSKHLPGEQVGLHTAKAAYYWGYHNTGKSHSLKVPSKTTLQRRGTSFSFTKHTLSAVCQAQVKAGKTDEKDSQ